MTLAKKIRKAADAASCYSGILAEKVLREEIKKCGLLWQAVATLALRALAAAQAEVEAGREPGPNSHICARIIYP